MRVQPEDLPYVAALIDNFGALRPRVANGNELPEIHIQGKVPAMHWLAELTGVRVIDIEKSYNRHQCSEHCPAKHTHIVSMTGRWVVTGARATIVLHNVERFMRVQGRRARDLVAMGQAVGYKGNVINDMTRLGWEIPDLRPQPRARVEVFAP